MSSLLLSPSFFSSFTTSFSKKGFDKAAAVPYVVVGRRGGGGRRRLNVSRSTSSSSSSPTSKSSSSVSSQGGRKKSSSFRANAFADDTEETTRSAATTTTTTTTTTTGGETFTVDVETRVARRAIQWDSIAIGDEDRAIYVSGVAFDSEAERQGVKPGMRLVAITDPVDKNEMWQMPKNVTFVRAMDAIRSTRAYDIQLTFEKEQSITREMVEYAKALSAGDDEEEEEDFSRTMMASSATSTSSRREPVSSTPRGPSRRINRPTSQGEKERPDLYSDNWQGDEYVGTGTWNELTVGLAIAVAVPLVITVFAAATNGVLWNVPDAVNRYR